MPLIPSMFDPSQELVAARFFDAHDKSYEAGDDVSVAPIGKDRGKSDVEYDIALRLWLVGYIVYKKDWRPTPVETPEQEAERVVTMEDTGNGWYLITTPWGEEGEKVHGKEAAEARYAEIVAQGAPAPESDEDRAAREKAEADAKAAEDARAAEEAAKEAEAKRIADEKAEAAKLPVETPKASTAEVPDTKAKKGK